MGCKISWFLISMITCFALSSYVESSNNFTRNSIDSLLKDNAFHALRNAHSGVLYHVKVPADLSGIEASVIRLRSGSFWTRGANFSYFNIQPRVLAIPYVRRLTIVNQNLGNWSSSLYNVKGYSLVTPVLGFMAYESSSSTLTLDVSGNPISVHFPNVSLPKGGANSTLKCVRYGKNGFVEFTDMKTPNVCFTKDQGHFAIVMRSVNSINKKNKKDKKKEKLWKCWIIGFVFGFLGLVVIGVVGTLIYKYVRMKRIGEMERQADEGEAFDTFWIGNSKMPSAKFSRTQPVLET